MSSPTKYTSDNSPTIKGVVSDSGSTVKSVQYQIGGTGGSWSDCDAEDGAFDSSVETFLCLDTSTHVDGPISVYFRTTDSKDNSTSTNSHTYTVDTVKPATFGLDSPADQAHIANQKPTFRWKMTEDAASGLSKYQVVVDGVVLIDDINPTDPGSGDGHVREDDNKYIRYDGEYIEVYAKPDSKKLSEGVRKWKVRAIDRAGNTRETEERTLHVELTEPTIQLDSIASLGGLALNSTSREGTVYFSTKARPTFKGVADAGTKIKLTIESDPITCETEAKTDSSWECTPDKDIPYGTHTVTISATSKAGHTRILPIFYLVVSSGTLETTIIEQNVIEKATGEAEQDDPGVCATYVVESGDSLMEIAKEQLGNEERYKELIALNRDTYPSIEAYPHLLEAGWELRLPCAQGENRRRREQETGQRAGTYTVKARVVGPDNDPIQGAKVTLFSTPREAVTDQNGEVLFADVERGEHTLVVNYNGQVGQQKVQLDGDVEEFQFTIQIEPKNPFKIPSVLAVTGILSIIVVVLSALLMRRRASV